MIAPPRDVQLGFTFLVDAIGGRRAAAQLLRVSVGTVRRWQNGIAGAPYQAAALLWWSTSWGQTSIAAEMQTRLDLVALRAAAAEKKSRILAERLASQGELLRRIDSAANDAVSDDALSPCASLPAPIPFSSESGPSSRAVCVLPWSIPSVVDELIDSVVGASGIPDRGIGLCMKPGQVRPNPRVDAHR